MKRKSYQRVREGEGNPRIVGISIHPNIRASSAGRVRGGGRGLHRVHRDVRDYVALCCATGHTLSPFFSLPFLFLHPSLLALLNSISGRCKFHYWPTDSAAVNASTRVHRLLFRIYTSVGIPRVSCETAGKNPRGLTSRSNSFSRAPSRARKGGKDVSLISFFFASDKKEGDRKDVVKELCAHIFAIYICF